MENHRLVSIVSENLNFTIIYNISLGNINITTHKYKIFIELK